MLFPNRLPTPIQLKHRNKRGQPNKVAGLEIKQKNKKCKRSHIEISIINVLPSYLFSLLFYITNIYMTHRRKYRSVLFYIL